MKVTYLNHSGFFLEWQDCCWLFDYYRGKIPKPDRDKPLFVFCSHSHGDHFNPAVFGLVEGYSRVTYVFANQVRQACRKLERNPEGINLSPAQWEDLGIGGDRELPHRVKVPPVIFLQNRTDRELPDGKGDVIRIHTLQSTDCGCGFFLSYKGKGVYHAGDLHWWTWPGESEAENRKMEADYKKEMEYLAGKQVDLLFSPLDPRQEEDYGLGLTYLLGQTGAKYVFPMHFWGDFSVIDRYLQEYKVPESVKICRIRKDGEDWEIPE